ncbi:MAG: SH3 domain-containing protein, partial [Caldilinea sp.]
VRSTPNLNLRSGPGTDFSVIGVLPVSSQLRPLARNADATWIEVQPQPTGQRGWVAGGERFIECAIELMTLPVGVLPPTPTQQPTATPSPTLPPVVVAPPTLPPVVVPPPPPPPPPTLPPIVVLPGGGPSGDGWSGALVTGANIGRVDSGVATFRDRVYFRAEVDSTPNNRRIDRVDFRIEDEFGDEFYRRTERTYGYCAFGGGEPECNVLEIRRGARWPDTDRAICNGDYTVFADIVLDNGGSGTWRAPFTVNHPDLPRCGETAQRADLVANIVQTGPGYASGSVYGALAFQVEAYDPERGFQDGDGIRNVDMRIFDPDGREVYQRTENVAGYCAFAGGEPDCNIWFFGDNGDAWPSGEAVRYGEPHVLRGIVNAEDGRTTNVEMRVFIEP